ncbi:MAG: alpha/beta hydrolase family esterase [Acidimicrobiia bacterium]
MANSRPAIIALLLLGIVGAACSGGGESGKGTTPKPSPKGSSTSTTPAAARATEALPAVTPRATTLHGTLRTPDGRDRTYHLYVPSTVGTGRSGPRVPLLVALHGGTGWGTQFERTSGFDGIAEANRFIVVYPDGVGVGPNQVNRTWNSGACCGAAQREDVDDVTFVRMLIERMRSQYPIDPSRVFAAGHSNGGMQAYRLACELADQIVAVGVQSSSLELDDCRPARPVSLLHIHGTADQNVPIGGGIGAEAISGVSFRPPIDGIRTFAELDGCPATPSHSTDPANADVSIQTWGPCDDGTEVRFMTVAGAPHAWMGSRSVIQRPGNVPYAKLDSSAVIWQFLITHPRA